MQRFARILLSLMKYILLFLIVLIAIWYYRSRPPKEVEEAVIPIPVVRVRRAEVGAISKTVTSSGIVEAEQMVTVLPQVGGRLEELFVEEGDQVEEGMVVGKIDTTSFQLQVDQARAAYISAESSFKRVENLLASGAATQQAFDQAKAQYEAYLSQYELAQLQLSYTDIISPFGGTVLIRHAAQGSLVGSQVPIVTVSDLSRLQVKFRVPETHYEEFYRKRGSIAVIMYRPDFPDERLSGTVLRIAPFVDPATKTFEVTCSLDNPDAVSPGMRLSVECLVSEIPDLYLLPYETYAGEGILWYVNPDSSTAHQLSIVPEHEDEDSFSIPPELREYLFIVDGQHFLKNGQTVHISDGEVR